MPIGFLEFDKDEVWSNPKAEVVQTFGSDNAWYYLTILPATLLALNPDTVLPKGFLTNRFLNLDGQKFSTSRGHAIWGEEASRYLSADVIRLGLACVRPEASESDFTLQGLRSTLENRGLRWQQWWAGVGELGLSSYPNSEKAWTEAQSAYHRSLIKLWKDALPARELRDFSLKKQVESLDRLVEVSENFQADDDQGQALSCLAVGIFARLCEPIMPDLAARLSKAVGVRLVADATCSLPTPGTPIKDLSSITLGTTAQIDELQHSRQAQV